MNLHKILEIIISDVLIGGLMSGFFVYISDKKAKENEKLLERTLRELEDHINLQFEVIKTLIRNNNP